MGLESSKPELTPEQIDLKHLGERFPYGDKELQHLYRAYQRLLKTRTDATVNGGSFLQDWGVECMEETNKKNKDFTEERRAILQMVEDHILEGTEIGNDLFHVACIVPGDVSWYNSATNNTNGTVTTDLVDEYTRMARLERLFDGMSNMARRGSKHAMTVLFDLIHYQHGAAQPAQSATGNPMDHTDASSAAKSIPSRPLVSVGYRLGLAIAFLQAIQQWEKEKQHWQFTDSEPKAELNAEKDAEEEENEEEDEGSETGSEIEDFTVDLLTKASQLLPQFLPRDSAVESLEPMARSLTEKCKSRVNRYGVLSNDQEGWNDDDPATIELQDVLEWNEVVAPLFASLLPTFLFHVLFWGKPYPPTRTPFVFPDHKTTQQQETKKNNKKNGQEAEIEPSILDESPRSFALACTSSSLMGKYFRLYTSSADGLSFNRLLNALLGYSGPTLLLIRCTTGGVFGAFTAHAWKETANFYGNTDCFLFQLYDSLAVYRPTGRGQNFMYCNSTARSKGYDQQAHGIGFGGTVQQPRLFIAENLMEDCQASSQDMTFENGSLLPHNHSTGSHSSGTGMRSAAPKSFDIEAMEVWGVGGSDIVQQALDGRNKAREIRAEGIKRARKVDKAQFLDDFRSGAIDSKAFAYRQQIDGRADQDVDERNRNISD